ncbi:multicopper oxidase-domain-containing protein [Talaromyces proteolyticus]|uniref:Multicopper oxidase-domain-containing protein n=1 Tax=Talaromyces proteolyticus TaxID=1131652 RepID=A0AAD4KPL4_9EURO|nr:multicopper oxidase-domain-containing protein [Talaromyces proteolyticus]KAH8696228.1 multicopper oxidase-domain-containing protein [Talaromyces proteolyticus]
MSVLQGLLATSTRRVVAVASFAVLLLTAPFLYFAFTLYPFWVNDPNTFVPGSSVVSGDRLVGFNDSHYPSADGQSDQSILEESDSDAFALHPNDHIFRKPQTIRMAWDVTMEERAPDGVKKMVYLINGQFPGPTIEARSGDELVINVYNSISNGDNDGISIHWHGLSMKGANHMDGVVGLTQCAIGPSENFTYQFRIDESQSGTFWYHAHAGLQRADGLFGGLVVHKPTDPGMESDLSTYQYETEKLLLVGDWYHQQADAVFNWYQDSRHYGKEPAPDSFLINGEGSFNCSAAVKARPVLCHSVPKPSIRLADTDRVRVRVVNTGVSSGLTLSISQGAMSLITVDGGNPVGNTPIAAVMGVLYPGERMDIILDNSLHENTQGHSGIRHLGRETELTFALDGENMQIENYALTRIQSFPLVWNERPMGTSWRETKVKPSPTSHILLSEVSGLPATSSSNFPEKPMETSVLYTAMQIRSSFHNRPVGIVNHTSWMIEDPKGKPLLALDPKDWAKATKQPSSIQSLHVPWYQQSGDNRWIDLVLNNMDDKGHPFHLHGYEFYVLAVQSTTQFGGYNPFDAASVDQAGPVNVLNPLRKDTVYVPRRGYAILRFPLNNDGLWLLHCHVLLHQAAGMGMVLRIGEIDLDAKHSASTMCNR